MVSTLRRAPPRAPVSQPLTLAAKRSEHRLSPAEAGSGLMLTNISVLPLPPRQGCVCVGGGRHGGGQADSRVSSVLLVAGQLVP